MFDKEEVYDYIDENILHSDPYDEADDKKKSKAVNQAVNTLEDHVDDVTLQDVAEQVVFLFKIDSSLQRAELGVNFFTVDGVQMTIQNKDRTLAPSIMKRHEITNTASRRVGSYAMGLYHTFRYGNGE